MEIYRDLDLSYIAQLLNFKIPRSGDDIPISLQELPIEMLEILTEAQNNLPIHLSISYFFQGEQTLVWKRFLTFSPEEMAMFANLTYKVKLTTDIEFYKNALKIAENIDECFPSGITPLQLANIAYIYLIAKDRNDPILLYNNLIILITTLKYIYRCI